jgi:hypothetical protein
MSDIVSFVLAAVLVLAAAYVPSYAALRLLRAGRPLALALAPVLGIAVVALTAVAAGFAGISWSLLVMLPVWLLLSAAGYGLRRWGLTLAPLSVPFEGKLPRLTPLWLLVSLAVALVPIAMHMGTPGAVLERWDTLYHLSALQRIRETGNASTLAIGSVAQVDGSAGFYPGAFHALASLVPGVPVPVLLNAAVLALAVVPWVLGIALFARVVFPAVSWAPMAAAVAATLAPAAPWDLWVHLSPVPNLTGFALLPGFLAAFCAAWKHLLETTVTSRGTWVLTVLLLALGGVGLGMTHPNVAVMALIVIAVITATTALPSRRTRPGLLVVPLLAVIPVAVLTWTPLGEKVTGFSGGLQVSLTAGIGELLLGLLTVWPMAIGVAIALLWWPGLVGAWSTPARWLTVAWIVVGVMYLDATQDSSLNLSILFYRGQDRISVPLTMITSLLVVPGLQLWQRGLEKTLDRGPLKDMRVLVVVLTCVAAVVAGTSVGPRGENAGKNLDAFSSGRSRFLQEDELEAWAAADVDLDHDKKVLASPVSGASHMYGIHGQQVYFPVAGMTLRQQDRDLMYALSEADGPVTTVEKCELLDAAGVGYIYQESTPYAYDPNYSNIDRASVEGLGEVVFETPHSRLIEITCDTDS